MCCSAGAAAPRAMRIEGRPYTTIERNLVERLVRVVLADMSGAFDPLSPVTFRFDRLETNPRFATIARPANAAVLAKLRIDMEDRGGRIEILIPYATLEPIRELLLQMFMGEKFGRDSHLGNPFGQRIADDRHENAGRPRRSHLPLQRSHELEAGLASDAERQSRRSDRPARGRSDAVSGPHGLAERPYCRARRGSDSAEERLRKIYERMDRHLLLIGILILVVGFGIMQATRLDQPS